MDKRFLQAHSEARWAFGLTLAYLAAWRPPEMIIWLNLLAFLAGNRFGRPTAAV